VFKTVLTLLSGTDCDKLTLSSALRVVAGSGGHIECLRLMPDPAELIAQVAQVDSGGWMILPDTIAAIEKEAKLRTEAARASFESFCRQENIETISDPTTKNVLSASFREAMGDEFDRVTEFGRYHDLIVLAGGHDRPGRLPEEALGGIIISGGRPVLLASAGEGKGPFRKIAIAWKETAEAARAVTAAMPLLEQAQNIEVINVCETDKQAAQGNNNTDALVSYLRWHSFDANGHFLVPQDRAAGQAALEHAEQVGADLLIMGAYGHSRLREFIFGGFTQRILKGANLPVLLFH
jgi:nucleotide-binding universal stress UspA family protein